MGHTSVSAKAQRASDTKGLVGEMGPELRRWESGVKKKERCLLLLVTLFWLSMITRKNGMPLGRILEVIPTGHFKIVDTFFPGRLCGGGVAVNANVCRL